jgi:hypothetical protein
MFLTLDELAMSSENLKSVSACAWSGVFSVGVQAPLVVRFSCEREAGVRSTEVRTLFTKASDISAAFEVVPVQSVLDVFVLDIHEASVHRVQEVWVMPQTEPRPQALLRLEGEFIFRNEALEPTSNLRNPQLLWGKTGRRPGAREPKGGGSGRVERSSLKSLGRGAGS